MHSPPPYHVLREASVGISTCNQNGYGGTTKWVEQLATVSVHATTRCPTVLARERSLQHELQLGAVRSGRSGVLEKPLPKFAGFIAPHDSSQESELVVVTLRVRSFVQQQWLSSPSLVFPSNGVPLTTKIDTLLHPLPNSPTGNGVSITT